MRGVGYVLVMLTAVALTACSETVTNAEYVERAQEYMDSGELNAASIELKNALLNEPDDPQTRRLLGITLFRLGDMAGAEKELRRAGDLGVVDASVLPLLSQALLAQGKYEDLENLSLERMAGTGAPLAEVMAAQGLGKLERGNLEEARPLIEDALNQAPDSTYSGVAKAQLLAAEYDLETAQQRLQRVLTLDADYAPAWSVLAAVQRSQQQYEKAEESFSKAIANRKNNTRDLIDRSMVRILLKNYEEAQRDVDLLLKRLPKDPEVNFAQGLIHLQANRLDASKGAFERSLRANPRQILPKYYLALTNLRLGNIEQADLYGEEAFAAAPALIPTRELLASIKLKKREYRRVEALVAPILAAGKGGFGTRDLLASAMSGQGKHEQAIPILEEMIGSQPGSAMLELRLGVAKLALGKTSEGVEHIRKAIQIDPDLNLARLLLVRHFAGQGDLDNGIRAAEAYRDDQPDNPEPWNLLGSLLRKQGDQEGALRAYERAAELEPGNLGANFSLAALALGTKDYPKARRHYQEVLTHHEDHLDTLLKLAFLEGIENDEAEMLRHLKRARSAHPGAVRPLVMLARYHLLKGESDKVAPLMLELGPQAKKDPAVLEVMAYSQIAQKQFMDAKFSLEDLISSRPRMAQSHYLLALVHAALKNEKSMESELEKTLELAPNNLAARIALARLAILTKQKEKAEQQVGELEERAPGHPDILHLKAMLARAEGDRQEAKGLFEELYAKAPSTKSMLAVARENWIAGDLEEALQIQEEWARRNPDDQLASLALAGAYHRKGNLDSAIAEYEGILKKDEDNVAALNYLAWTLREEQPEKALRYAEKARDLAPDSAQVLDTLAMVQLQNRQLKRASRSIERAVQKSPNNRSFRYHSAVIAEASGDIWGATTILSELLEDPAGFLERQEAEEMLQRLRPN